MSTGRSRAGAVPRARRLRASAGRGSSAAAPRSGSALWRRAARARVANTTVCARRAACAAVATACRAHAGRRSARARRRRRGQRARVHGPPHVDGESHRALLEGDRRDEPSVGKRGRRRACGVFVTDDTQIAPHSLGGPQLVPACASHLWRTCARSLRVRTSRTPNHLIDGHHGGAPEEAAPARRRDNASTCAVDVEENTVDVFSECLRAENFPGALFETT